jgi:hypothetical protein
MFDVSNKHTAQLNEARIACRGSITSGFSINGDNVPITLADYDEALEKIHEHLGVFTEKDEESEEEFEPVNLPVTSRRTVPTRAPTIPQDNANTSTTSYVMTEKARLDNRVREERMASSGIVPAEPPIEQSEELDMVGSVSSDQEMGDGQNQV